MRKEEKCKKDHLTFLILVLFAGWRSLRFVVLSSSTLELLVDSSSESSSVSVSELESS